MSIPDDVDYGAHLARRAEWLTTTCVHAGESADAGPLDTPIVLSSAFGFASAEEAAGAFRGENDAYIYGRWGNPTVEVLEAKIAALEEAEAACATASGMAAISGAILSVCSSGDHIVAPRSMYAESARLFFSLSWNGKGLLRDSVPRSSSSRRSGLERRS